MTESQLDVVIDWLLGYGCHISGRLTERGFLNFAVWIYYSFFCSAHSKNGLLKLIDLLVQSGISSLFFFIQSLH